MKNCIGKDLSKIPLPVNFSEPLSMLQRLVEDYEYRYYLPVSIAGHLYAITLFWRPVFRSLCVSIFPFLCLSLPFYVSLSPFLCVSLPFYVSLSPSLCVSLYPSISLLHVNLNDLQ